MMQVKAPVLSNRQVMAGTRLVWLEAPQMAAEAKPGQFIMVRCGDETVLPRPLSVHCVEGGNVAVLFMVRGKGTEWLAGRRKGQSVTVFGPLGNGFTVDVKAKTLLLVAGGIGIAPLCLLAERAIEQRKRVVLLHGAATAKQLYPVERLPSGVESVLATDDGTEGHKGLITSLLHEYAPAADQIFACGPLPMYRAMAQHGKKMGIEGKRVQVSLEMRMGCGVGVCYGCTIRTRHGLKQACKDGPVFELQEIVWDELLRV